MAVSNRDDFSQKIKTAIASRAGYRCSLPNCRAHTIGAGGTPDGSLSVGVACHIHAASPNGPRYSANQTTEERSSSDNGIWCCANCSRIVDGATSPRSPRSSFVGLEQSTRRGCVGLLARAQMPRR